MANDIKIRISAEDLASPKVDSFKDKVLNLGKTLGPALAVGGVAAAGAAVLKFGGDFQNATKTIAVGTGETGNPYA